MRWILWHKGRETEAKKIFDSSIDFFREMTSRPFQFDRSWAWIMLAELNALMSNKDEAYKWLYGLEKHGFNYGFEVFIQHEPLFKSLWEDQGFKDLIARVTEQKKKLTAEAHKLREEGII